MRVESIHVTEPHSFRRATTPGKAERETESLLSFLEACTEEFEKFPEHPRELEFDLKGVLK